MEVSVSRQYWIVECRLGSPIRLHHVLNPGYGGRGWYKSISSVEAFENNEQKRVERDYYCKDRTPPFEFWVFKHHEYDFYNRADRTSDLNPFLGLDVVESGSIFDFYKSISYDFKNKVYVSD